MSEPRFVHLRIHSDYSMIHGIAKIDQLVKKAALLGMPALGITDFTNLCGFIKFYRATYKFGIKPIIGADFKVKNSISPNILTKLTILASNNVGYKNLTLLISRAYQKGYGTNGPCIKREWLMALKSGLIVLSGGYSGDIGYGLIHKNHELVNHSLEFYKKHFPSNFYIEISRTGSKIEEQYLALAIKLAMVENIPLVATNEVYFLSKIDFEAHEIRVAIHQGHILNDSNRSYKYNEQQYMRTENEMCNLFKDIPEALINSVEIAKRCNVRITLGKYFLPQFPTGNLNPQQFLINKATSGLEERLKFIFPDPNIRIEKRKEYDKRLNIELNIINKMGFPSYFLIVMEFVQWSKDNCIPVGPGRGSGAGSLVAYALQITDINPLEFNLIFERFLNLERVSLPDFDIDFCMEKRDMVIEHVSNIYGKDAVAQIITFGTMTAKSVIRDVGRVLGYPYGFVERISKMIPSDIGITIERAFTLEPKLSELYKIDEDVKSIIDMARKLEGVIRNASKHAGGLVISPTRITDFTPLHCDENGNNPITQFDKDDIEYIGLVKFDFLGLRTLTIINWAIEMINLTRNNQSITPVNIASIPLNDKKTFQILQQAKTTAVFQLESKGMRDLIKRLKPDCFEDIIALIALFRPGPLQSGMVDNFINRKHGREKVSYPDIKCQHESLKPILESTYGIILYQEQVMQIAQVLAGYTLGKADILRYAMGKKQPIEMVKQRSFFKRGSEKKGISSEMALKIFSMLEKFAGYGFNKSHSTAYALISYQTLWLKTHYPAQFMAAVLTAYMDNTNKIVSLIDECRMMGLTILPPDINVSLYTFYVNDLGKIVYGMGAIKGIGKTAIENIIYARNQGGRFIDLLDLCNRIDTKKLNQSMMKKMILSGCCDSLGSHRAAMINSLSQAFNIAVQNSIARLHGQADMFNGAIESKHFYPKEVSVWPDHLRLQGERDTLGLYLTGHPINTYLEEIKFYNKGLWIKDINSHYEGNKIIVIVGLLTTIRSFLTKNNKKISMCYLEDHSGSLEVIIFSDILEIYQPLLKKDNILIINGKIQYDNFRKRQQIVAQKIMNLKEARKKYVRGISLWLTSSQVTNRFLSTLKKYLSFHCGGSIPLYVYYKNTDAQIKFTFSKKWYISLNDSLIEDLKYLVGFNQVKLEFD
ncbi:DNA polymerase III subunit alpha [Candidatus Ishikawella capsulata]|uniref:DNA polymerase III subunit alpha n=1 Tax=Candidatus Ishikawaella capsulata Mpkobe TaxID=476281 RepID=C5WCJ9_9ENTR|nr:DNA polymerase III subunit alpha [Candidatus Ishikawaella capsulata]BAH83055.1 DNA polymerase III subunit alpha [Candidatus Ishikawaella capsulata Mpkobe]